MMKWVVRGFGVATAGMIGVPALVSVVSPAVKSRRAPQWKTLGKIRDFPVGGMKRAVISIPETFWSRSLGEKSVYVWRASESEIIVYSRSCTDLGCPVRWDPGSEWFYCPCHGGKFAKDGEVVSGPLRKPLYRYAVRIRNGEVEIDVNSLPPMT